MSIFSSDFRKFDRQAAQAYLILHNELNQPMNICAGGSLKIPLNIDTFLRVKHDAAVLCTFCHVNRDILSLKVMKSAYSFMAVLKAVNN